MGDPTEPNGDQEYSRVGHTSLPDREPESSPFGRTGWSWPVRIVKARSGRRRANPRTAGSELGQVREQCRSRSRRNSMVRAPTASGTLTDLVQSAVVCLIERLADYAPDEARGLLGALHEDLANEGRDASWLDPAWHLTRPELW